MTKLILLAILITSFIKTQAQIIKKGTISGKVTNENHIPIPGATVELTGPNLATLTDEQGNYLLKVPAGSYKLSAKSLGHLTAETQVRVPANQNVQNTLILIETSESLEDVTISGVKVKTATATRSLMPIQDIPQSIAVIGQRVIKQQAAIDLSTITRNISGLNFTGNYSGAGSAQFFNARGFDLNDSQSYRLNVK
jgi:iron complex outermembrane receptor protein